MKHPILMSLAVATGFTLPALNAVASNFGGGWKHDEHTNTLYWSGAPEPARQAEAVSNQPKIVNSFGGGWAHDKHTNTLYWSLAPETGGEASAHHEKQTKSPNSFGRGWAHDKHTGTLSYHPDSYGEGQETRYD